jgi:polysaccharide deacetylase family protein (PEP-CTERM system associated)
MRSIYTSPGPRAGRPSGPNGRSHPSIPPSTAPRSMHLRADVLTIALEDYYHAARLRPWIREETWYRFEDRLTESTQRILDLLDRFGAHATFFVGLRTAESAPALVRQVANRGHEIASRGDLKVIQSDLNAERLREDASRCKEHLEDLIGRRVLGYRLANGWLELDDLWVLDILADCGYLYDSSVGPLLGAKPAELWLQSRPPWSLSQRGFREVSVSSLPLLGFHVSMAGGGLLRHLPEEYVRRAVAQWHSSRTEPCVMYFRTWELDPGQPRISAGSLASRFHYRNLERMSVLLEELLTTYRSTTVASHLGLDLALQQPSGNGTPAASKLPLRVHAPGSSPGPTAEPIPVTVVVPCFNETQSLPYLRNTLRGVAADLRDSYLFRFVFVDDCSSDETWPMLQELFGAWPNSQFIRHEQNRGVAATIQTGIRLANTEIVCSIDCDCTYDPSELGRMIPLLTDGVDLVTASPYHPGGRVRNVAHWRLVLSKSLSRFYRLLLHHKLSTYTSCFRVYRRRSAVQIEVRNSGFLGVAELLARSDLAGQRIVEYPTTLEARVLGTSKMKVIHTIAGHVGLLAELGRLRLSRPKGSLKADVAS